jgi:flagellar motor switch protein FliM
VTPPANAAARPVVPYDFRRPIQLSREHSRILQVAFEDFARQCSTTLTATLRRICGANLRSIEQRSYGEYVASLQPTTYLTIFSAEPVEGLAVLNLPMHAVMTCLDHMLGGPGAAKQPERPLTDIESAVAEGLTERLLHELRTSLEGTVEVQPAKVEIEYSPQFMQAGSPNDVVVVVTLDLVLGKATSELTLCLPFNGLLPQLEAAAAPAPVSERERATRARSAGLLHEQFQGLPIEVAVRFRPTLLHPVDLDDLAVGDVIRLSHPAVAPLEVSADGATFAYASPGTQGKRLAALVVNTPGDHS